MRALFRLLKGGRHPLFSSSVKEVTKICSATIISARGPHSQDLHPRGRPYNYSERRYTFLDVFLDSTMKRFNENSKLIVVEGNIGTDKENIAKKIAYEFDMKYVPAFHCDDIYMREDGRIDVRDFNGMIPEHLQAWDFERIFSQKSPEDARNGSLSQYSFFKFKFLKYYYAVCHILNTGQGVVMNGSMFNEIAYLRALKETGVLSKHGYNFLSKPVWTVLGRAIAPHLIVYLDAPVSYCRKLIKRRGRPYEQNSAVLTDEFLQSMENAYNRDYFPYLENSSQIYTLDVPHMPSWEIIVEDLEELQLDGPVENKYDMFLEWEFPTDLQMNCLRHRYCPGLTSKWNDLWVQPPPFDAPELLIGDDNMEAYREYSGLYEIRFAR